MISDAERNYEPHKWEEIDDIPEDRRPLSMSELFYFCTSDSQRFADLVALGRGETAFLLDYEIYSLGHEPTCGCVLMKTGSEQVILTVFTSEGNKHYLEVV